MAGTITKAIHSGYIYGESLVDYPTIHDLADGLGVANDCSPYIGQVFDHSSGYSVTIIPDGVGNETGLESVVGAATHWEACKSDDNGSSYVGESRSGSHSDLFTLEDTAEVGEITLVRVYRKSTLISGSGKFGLKLRTHDTDYTTAYTQNVISGTYDTYYSGYTKNPFTGVAWTWNEINALQAGFYIESLAGEVRFTYTWVVIYYNKPTWFIARNGLVFDLTGLSIIPISVTLSLLVQYATNDTGFDIVLLTGDDLADVLDVADYGELLVRTTSFGSVSIPSGEISEAWYTITLNATGIAYVLAHMGGKLRFGLRSSRDVSSITPKLNGNSQYYEAVYYYGSNAIEVDKPKLTINHGGLIQAYIIG